MKRIKKASILILAVMAFFAGIQTVSANAPTPAIRVDAALIFNSATATSAIGQIHRGTICQLHEMRNNRYNLTVVGGTAAQHNGWLWSTVWTARSNF